MKHHALIKNSSGGKLLVLILVVLFSFSNYTQAIGRTNTIVGGPIFENTTWTKDGNPYIVIDTIDVLSGVTLTIEPGVQVKFNSGERLLVSGDLIAIGTETEPILFTSNLPNPQPGDWGNIEFLEGSLPTQVDPSGNYLSGSILKHCIVEYGGKNVYAAIWVISHYISNCIIRNNTTEAIRSVGSPTAITYVIENQLINNSSGVVGYYMLIDGNQIYNNNADSIGGIYAHWSTVTNNIVSGNGNRVYEYLDTRLGGISAESSTVEKNIVRDNFGKDGGGIKVFSSTVKDNVVIGNTAVSRGAGISAINSILQNNIVSNNKLTGGPSTGNEGGGGIYAEDSTIDDNIVMLNYSHLYGGGIYAINSPMSANFISQNVAQDGAGIYATESKVVGNTISSNQNLNDVSFGGSGAYLIGSQDVYSNTITGNFGLSGAWSGGLGLSGTPNVHYNSILNNNPYDVMVKENLDINGTNNYWGTANSAEIALHIFDWYDYSFRGKFNFIPYLLAPDLSTPLIPPQNLIRNDLDGSIYLSWSASPITSSEWGFNLYYDTDEKAPPYDGLGILGGASPIDLGNVTELSISDLDTCTNYYFALTAYDGLGNESMYSNVISVERYCLYLPLTLIESE